MAYSKDIFVQQILTRRFSKVYALFLRECWIRFHISQIFQSIHIVITTPPQCFEDFWVALEYSKNLLCKVYWHVWILLTQSH